MRNNKEIVKKCLAYLLPSNPRPGRFYLLPKIHKGVLPPPGRPIILAILIPHRENLRISRFLPATLITINSFPCQGFRSYFLYIPQNLGPLPQNTISNLWCRLSLYQHPVGRGRKIRVNCTLIQARPHNATPSNQSLLKLLCHVFQRKHFYLLQWRPITLLPPD